MVLINLGSLSDSELRYIAQQEGFDDWQEADRDDLVERLEEKYEDEDVSLPESDGSGAAQNRYVTSLTDFGMNASTADELPGVGPLPTEYNDTCLHLIVRDPQWAFVYWSIAPTLREKLDGRIGDSHLFLRVEMKDNESGDSTFFDINVELTDESWNINLPSTGRTYRVVLYHTERDGSIKELARSSSVSIEQPYWLGHPEEMQENPRFDEVQFSALVSCQGDFAENMFARNLVTTLTEGTFHGHN